jgi:hypothetical protein
LFVKKGTNVMKVRSTLCTLSATLVALGCAQTVRAAQVALGSDYFQTQPGTMFNFGPPIGTVDFTGNSIGPGATDTIVERLADATINGNSIPIQIVALSLESTAPVSIGGFNYNASVTLDPSHLGNDMGMMMIMGSSAGGTFNSFFDVFFEVQFAPINGGPSLAPFFDHVLLNNTGATWSPTPPPGAVIVKGPDDDPVGAVGLPPTAADQMANLHDSCSDPTICLDSTIPEVDFFVVGNVIEDSSGMAHHVVTNSLNTPEPGTFLSLAAFAAGFVWMRLKTKRR